MKTLITLCAAFLFTGCVLDRERPPDGEDPPEAATLELAYLSGHFGSYWDCPEEAYQPPGAADESNGVAASRVADCGDGDDCGGPLNCEPAQLTIQIANIGAELVDGIRVREIQVLDADGEVHTILPVVSVDTIELDAFDGVVEAGETATLRVDFRGPRSLSDLLGERVQEAPVKIIVEVEAQNTEELITPPIHSSPIVVT